MLCLVMMNGYACYDKWLCIDSIDCIQQVSRLERKLAEIEEQLHLEMTAKDELESANRAITIKLAKITEELGEEVWYKI